MLNCILGMVEKTKRALAILQHRSYSDRQDVALWRSRHLDGTEFDIKKRATDILPHYKAGEEVARRRPGETKILPFFGRMVHVSVEIEELFSKYSTFITKGMGEGLV